MEKINTKQLNLALFITILIIVGLFFYTENSSSNMLYEINKELVTRDKNIEDLGEEIDLLKVQVEVLIGEAQDATKEEINKKITALENQLEEEKNQRESLENQLESEVGLSSARLGELEKDAFSSNTLSTIVSKWRGRTANVRCNFVSGSSSGSGVLAKFNEEGAEIYGVLTNQHVMVDVLGRTASSCSITLPDSNTQITGTLENGELEFSTNGHDFGRILVSNPSEQIKQVAARENNFCLQTPQLGDGLVILGYPSIGSGSDVTATEGIVSGFEDNFYITSAKVEQGNSGGTAVLIKDNCLLGIPTFVQFGSLESLARILKIDVLYK